MVIEGLVGQNGRNARTIHQLWRGSDHTDISIILRNGFAVELYQPLSQVLEEIRARNDGFIDHVALDVSDIDQAYTELKDTGLSPMEGAPVELPFWENGAKYFNVRGPDGEKIEFNQIL